MHYVIFVPGSPIRNQATLQSIGLGDLITRDQGPSWADVARGPGGNPGCLITWLKGVPEEDPPLNDLDFYDWHEGPKPVKYWVGIPKDPKLLPGPRDLQKSEPLRGNQVLLKDNRYWLIPSAYHLPCEHGIDFETGEYKPSVSPAFKDYCDSATRLATGFFEKQEEVERLSSLYRSGLISKNDEFLEITMKDGWDQACRALSLNYRLCPSIITILRLLGDREMAAINTAAIDLPLIQELVKKKTETPTIGIPVGLNS